MIRKIMVPVRGDGKGDCVFAHAAALAKSFGAHVEVVHCHPKPEDMMPFGVVVPGFMRKQIEEVAAKNYAIDEEQVRKAFKDLAVEMALPEQAPAAGTASASFVEYSGKQVDAVRHFARLSDLVCVAQPDAELNLGANTLKSAIYSSGRPVMMCPPREDRPQNIGKHVALGWNGSLEATRALGSAMPVLQAAEKVTILTTGDTPHAATAEELVDYLALHGAAAEINRFKKKGNIGRTLLKLCDAEGVDLLVMGAYHESYERETLLGGNSQAVVNEAKIPVILAH